MEAVVCRKRLCFVLDRYSDLSKPIYIKGAITECEELNYPAAIAVGILTLDVDGCARQKAPGKSRPATPNPDKRLYQ